MSIQDHVVQLEKLSVLDEVIRQIDEQLTQDRETLSTLRQELARQDATIESDEKSIAEMSRARLDLTQEVRQMGGQLDKSRDKLARSRNEREQNAATREIEELRRIQKDREEDIGRLQLLETQALKSKEEAEAKRAQVMQQLGQIEGETTQRLQQIEADRNQKMEQRKQLTKGLPRNILSRYEMIRQRKGVAIAVTHEGTCEACHMAVPPQLFQKVRRAEGLELCPSCQRILYFKPPPPKPEEP